MRSCISNSFISFPRFLCYSLFADVHIFVMSVRAVAVACACYRAQAANADSAAPALTRSNSVNAAVYSAFLAIIEDNSSFPSTDMVKVKAWLAGAGLQVR